MALSGSFVLRVMLCSIDLNPKLQVGQAESNTAADWLDCLLADP